MAESGKIFPAYTHIEIDENGVIWCIHNHFESDSVILEMESTANGHVIYDDGWALAEDYDDTFDEDFL